MKAVELKRSFYFVLGFTLFLWGIKLVEYFLSIRLWWFGINPGELVGLIGIFTAPIIHGSFEHLISNTPAIIILGTVLLYAYPKSARIVLPVVWLLTGLGVWLTARPLFHFGASGLTYGCMAFIFIIGILRRDSLAIALSLLVFFLYGTMIWGIFPHQAGVSFETHLWAAGLGAACAIILRNYDPKPPVKHYDWEDEDYTTENDPQIADTWEDNNENLSKDIEDKYN